MKNYKQKILIVILLVAIAFCTELLKRQVFAADFFINQVTGKIIIDISNHGKAWYIFPADKRRYYLGRPKEAFLLAKNLALEEQPSTISSLKINFAFLGNTSNDKDQDGLSDNLESWLKTDPNKNDTDGDGFADKTEIVNNYDPKVKSPVKININTASAKKLSGNFIFNKSQIGLWYINPATLQAYYIENETAMLKLMQNVALGMDGTSLQRIEGLVIGPQYMSEEIKKNETKPDTQSGQIRYTDDSKSYSFAFPQTWTIKKYPDAPELVHVTDATRDFISEKKASIMIQIINMGASSTLDSFKIKSAKGMVISQESTKVIGGKQSFNKITEFPHMRTRSTVVDLLNGRFLMITLNTPLEIKDSYDQTFNELVGSLLF